VSICDFQLLPLAGPSLAAAGGAARPGVGLSPAAPGSGDPIARAAAKAAAFMRTQKGR
jgi:hypothetical protein